MSAESEQLAAHAWIVARRSNENVAWKAAEECAEYARFVTADVQAERDAYRKAKAENDERFQLEAAAQRERADVAESVLAEAQAWLAYATELLERVEDATSWQEAIDISRERDTHPARDVFDAAREKAFDAGARRGEWESRAMESDREQPPTWQEWKAGR